MVLEDFLFPQEVIQYQSKYYVKYGATDYALYITNRRVIGHRRGGLITKKDRVFSIALEEITNLRYDEVGIIRKSGWLTIETKTKKIPFHGDIGDVKVIWQEMQKFLGFTAGKGAQNEEFVKTAPQSSVSVNVNSSPSTPDDDPLKILALRLAKGEITMEQYNEMKKALSSN